MNECALNQTRAHSVQFNERQTQCLESQLNKLYVGVKACAKYSPALILWIKRKHETNKQINETKIKSKNDKKQMYINGCGDKKSN